MSADKRRDEALTRSVKAHVDREEAKPLGHKLVWEPSPHAYEPGWCFQLVGTCRVCGATVTATPGATSTIGPVDARRVRCESG